MVLSQMDFKKNLKLLPRKRIFDLMEQIPSHPLSMIIAPMGYGKTASLRSYIERTELESLWMTMPRATNLSETELFWFLLVRAVTRRDAAFAQRLSRMGFPQNSIDVFRIIDMLHDLPPERPLLGSSTTCTSSRARPSTSSSIRWAAPASPGCGS